MSVDCEACEHRRVLLENPSLGRPGDHCYMFGTKPGPYCAQFRKDTSPAAKTKDAELAEQVAAIRAETARRRADNFAKRQPKDKTNGA